MTESIFIHKDQGLAFPNSESTYRKKKKNVEKNGQQNTNSCLSLSQKRKIASALYSQQLEYTAHSSPHTIFQGPFYNDVSFQMRQGASCKGVNVEAALPSSYFSVDKVVNVSVLLSVKCLSTL